MLCLLLFLEFAFYSRPRNIALGVVDGLLEMQLLPSNLLAYILLRLLQFAHLLLAFAPQRLHLLILLLQLVEGFQLLALPMLQVLALVE